MPKKRRHDSVLTRGIVHSQHRAVWIIPLVYVITLQHKASSRNSSEQVRNLRTNGHWPKGKGVPLSFAKKLELIYHYSKQFHITHKHCICQSIALSHAKLCVGRCNALRWRMQSFALAIAKLCHLQSIKSAAKFLQTRAELAKLA